MKRAARRRRRDKLVVACMSQSGSHCGLLMIPMMVVFGLGLVLGASWGRPDLIMPVVLPSMLVLFLAFTLYYYLRGYTACGACDQPVNASWAACPHCASTLER